LLALGTGEVQACISGVGNWGLAWGQPGGWEVGVGINCLKADGFSVPGSEGGELLSWHVESWDVRFCLQGAASGDKPFLVSCIRALEGADALTETCP